MISTRQFPNVDGVINRFLIDFPIASDQHVKVYVHNLFEPTISDVVSSNTYDLIDNSIVFYVAPISGSIVTIEVATSPEEFGSAVSLPAADVATNAALVAEGYALSSLGYKNQAGVYAGQASTSATNAALSATQADSFRGLAVLAANDASIYVAQAYTHRTGAELAQSRTEALEISFTDTATGAIAIANGAVTTANTASANASAAVTTANSANTNSQTAINNAISAINTANGVALTANTALTNANTALTNANSAATTATAAQTTATAAQTTATAAQTTASAAQTTASAAQTTASAAQTAATAAQTTADTANTTANAANTIANNANTTANNAYSLVTFFHAGKLVTKPYSSSSSNSYAGAMYYNTATNKNMIYGYNSYTGLYDDLILITSGDIFQPGIYNNIYVNAVFGGGGLFLEQNGGSGLNQSLGYLNMFTDDFGNSARDSVSLGNGWFMPNQDTTLSLGSSSKRWGTIYAATGTIDTSDGRLKQQILPLNQLEKNVAIKLKGAIKTFKFNDAVALKGDGARIHTGIIAQEVKAIFESEGLIAENYAILCYDSWEETVGVSEVKDTNGNITIHAIEHIPAGDRYGIRYEELLAFIISAM